MLSIEEILGKTVKVNKTIYGESNETPKDYKFIKGDLLEVIRYDNETGIFYTSSKFDNNDWEFDCIPFLKSIHLFKNK